MLPDHDINSTIVNNAAVNMNNALSTPGLTDEERLKAYNKAFNEYQNITRKDSDAMINDTHSSQPPTNAKPTLIDSGFDDSSLKHKLTTKQQMYIDELLKVAQESDGSIEFSSDGKIVLGNKVLLGDAKTYFDAIVTDKRSLDVNKDTVELTKTLLQYGLPKKYVKNSRLNQILADNNRSSSVSTSWSSE